MKFIFSVLFSFGVFSAASAQSMEMERNQAAVGLNYFNLIDFEAERFFFGRSTKSLYLKFGFDAGLQLNGLKEGYKYTIGTRWFLKQGKNLTVGAEAIYVSQEYVSRMTKSLGGSVLLGYTLLIKRRVSILPYMLNGIYRKEEYQPGNKEVTFSRRVEYLPNFGLDVGFRF